MQRSLLLVICQPTVFRGVTPVWVWFLIAGMSRLERMSITWERMQKEESTESRKIPTAR